MIVILNEVCCITFCFDTRVIDITVMTRWEKNQHDLSRSG